MQMKIVFNSFSKIFSQFSEEDRQLYAYEILLPLYKVCEGFAGRVVTGDFSLLYLAISIYLLQYRVYTLVTYISFYLFIPFVELISHFIIMNVMEFNKIFELIPSNYLN